MVSGKNQDYRHFIFCGITFLFIVIFVVAVEYFGDGGVFDSRELSIKEAFNHHTANEGIMYMAVEGDLENIDKPFFVETERKLSNPLARMAVLRKEKMIKALVKLGANPQKALKMLKDDSGSQAFLKKLISQ